MIYRLGASLYYASETLHDLLDEVKEKGSRLLLAELDDGVRAELDRYGLTRRDRRRRDVRLGRRRGRCLRRPRSVRLVDVPMRSSSRSRPLDVAVVRALFA